jgi:putative NIF3 family GTP cyclohydrolase 1 type 2
MKLKEIFDRVIKFGIEHDPRGAKAVKGHLKNLEDKYKLLKEKERKEFDVEQLRNPYHDTRILNGDPDLEVNEVLVGIDIDVGEILLADTLRRRGEKIDLVISHHPSGKAYANFYEVMYMQAEILNNVGIPINIAESLTTEHMREVERRIVALNHTRAVDAAVILNLPFICAHTPADNFVASYLKNLFDRKQPENLKDIIDILMEIPEYRESKALNRPPKILTGSEQNRAGKIFVDMTGGTEGAKELLDKMEIAGVSTLVCMHLSEEHFKKAKDNHLNVIIAGHISSDTVGLNLLLDEITQKESFKIVCCSGFKRFKRK